MLVGVTINLTLYEFRKHQVCREVSDKQLLNYLQGSIFVSISFKFSDYGNRYYSYTQTTMNPHIAIGTDLEIFHKCVEILCFNMHFAVSQAIPMTIHIIYSRLSYN